MVEYFFILGRNSTLAVVELISIFDKLKADYSFKEISPEVAIISFSQSLNISTLMDTLGGTVKVGQLIDKVLLNEDESKFFQIFSSYNLLNQYLARHVNRLHFGLSVYNANGDEIYLRHLYRQLQDLNMRIKKNLITEGLRVGYVKNKERFLTSVSVDKNQLIEKGAEIVLILTQKSILIGKTLKVQDYAGFTYRDFNRPRKDKRSGILPPKLARVMLNLARVDKEDHLFDPFCGSGTILQEAVILGYKNLIGSDISFKAISDTRNNLDWLFANFKERNRKSYNIRLFASDIKKVNNYLKESSVGAVITEPFLGPPLFKRPQISMIISIFSQLKELYLTAFKELQSLLKQSGEIIIIFPVFVDKGKQYFLEILPEIKELGFLQNEFIPKSLSRSFFPELTKRRTVIYGSNEQFLKREILSFRKKY